MAEQPHRRVPVKVLIVIGRGDGRERRLAVLDRVPHRGQFGPHRRSLAGVLRFMWVKLRLFLGRSSFDIEIFKGAWFL